MARTSTSTRSHTSGGGALPRWLRLLTLPAVIAGLGVAMFLERRRPLRRRVERTATRTVRNLTVAALGAAALQIAERPLVQPLAALVERRRLGLLPRLGLPRPLETACAVILMDYTLYVWHVLAHRVPWLWRFHVVHHADLDMDASTAVRFHFGELTLSAPWRAAQVLAIGVSPRALSLWQTLLFASILFHHSNLRLPIGVERWLSRLIVTPRLHGIHHSAVRAETDSNWSNILAIWDWLHGTLRLDVPQSAITIGVPAYRAPADVSLGRVLAMPFVEQRPVWEAAEPRELIRQPSAPASGSSLLQT